MKTKLSSSSYSSTTIPFPLKISNNLSLLFWNNFWTSKKWLNIRNMWLTLLPNWSNCPWLLTLKAPKFLSSVITVGRLRKTSLRLILLENDGSQNLSHYRHILIRNPNFNSRNILGLMSLRSHSNSMSLFSAITGWPLSSLVTPSLVIPSKPFCTSFGTF